MYYTYIIYIYNPFLRDYNTIFELLRKVYQKGQILVSYTSPLIKSNILYRVPKPYITSLIKWSKLSK